MTNTPTKSYTTPEDALKDLFGYPSFRPGQKAIIDSILSGRDAFAVMPTGAGKSLCYQIPALLLPGITLVISPLISLMQDQVKALNEAGISAAFINSSLSDSAFFETVGAARMGLYKIIYVAPERLTTEEVRDDIVSTLGLENPYTMVTGFDRENLFFQVDKPDSKEQYILDYIAEHPGESGIIYCATRKNVDSVYELLKEKGLSVAKYHAGMGAADRKQMQDDFVFDYVSIVVATNAFGMGIDKSNVRFVIHYNMPQSMENYYQEAGRAGRDGLDSKCILLFSAQDIVINRLLLEHKEMPDLDFTERQIIRRRDEKRLQAMEGYCYTTECLRNYILKYFGENPDKPCEDCGNCLRDFETIDMTEEAKKIINCVYEARGRYGKTIIIDTVSGAKTARLEEVGAVRYKSYGVLASSNKKLLRRLIDQLVLEGYLKLGDYQVVKLGDISTLKSPDAKVLVRITDEDKLPTKAARAKERAARTVKSKNKGSRTKTSKEKSVNRKESLTPDELKLFEKLRELRLQIAREESMPPYIVFSDRTLIDMAVKAPVKKDEMMEVSGVGENKYAKYGERFIASIEEWAKTAG